MLVGVRELRRMTRTGPTTLNQRELLGRMAEPNVRYAVAHQAYRVQVKTGIFPVFFFLRKCMPVGEPYRPLHSRPPMRPPARRDNNGDDGEVASNALLLGHSAMAAWCTLPPSYWIHSPAARCGHPAVMPHQASCGKLRPPRRNVQFQFQFRRRPLPTSYFSIS